jgi:ankyrin repeat protein
MDEDNKTNEYLFECMRNHEWDKLKETINSYENINLNKKDGNNYNLILYAIKYNRLDIVKLLLEKKCNIDVVDFYNRSLLYEAIISDYYDIIEAIINYAVENIGLSIIDIKDNAGQIPLHYAIKNNKIEIIKLLLKNKSNVNIHNNDGYNSLHLAIRKKNLEVCKMIIDNGIYINTKTIITGDTALHLSLNLQTNEITKLLLENKANPKIQDDGNEYTPLHYAVAWNNYDMINLLLDYGADPNIQDNMGNTPLMWCVKQDEKESCKKLIQNKKIEINCNITDIYGDLPLHIIFENYDSSKSYYLETLIENTNVNIIDKYNNSILHYLCINELWKKYENILAKKKLNIFVFNDANKTPYDYVSKDDKEHFMNLLVSAYIHVLQTNDKKWIDEDDIKCVDNKNTKYCMSEIKKKILNNLELFKIKQTNICIKSYPRDIKKCITLDEGENIEFCTFTGTLFDILIGIIFLMKKHKNVCSIINNKNEIINERMCDFYKERGMVINDNCEFISFEIVWKDNKLIMIENFVLLFEKALTNNNRFIIIPIGIEIKNGSHSNYLLFDKNNYEIERFEPHGKNISSNFNYKAEYLDELLEKYFKNIDSKIIYISPDKYLPKISFQILDSVENNSIKIGDPKGFCAIWAIWYIDNRLTFEDITREKLIKILLSNIKNQRLSYKNIIRNYSKNIIDYRDKFLKQININMNDFMNNKYTNQQINKLLYLLNNEIVKSHN